MSYSSKCFHSGSLLEVCFSTERDLPLIATPFMALIIKSVLARAQSMYPVRLVAIVVMGNHIHILLVVKSPADIPRFKEYVKRELAHAINNLRGFNRITVWIDGSDDSVILDPQMAIERLVYFYSNPQKANCVEKIDEYPNFTSWDSFLLGGSVESIPRIPRNAIPQLPPGVIPLSKQRSITQAILLEGREDYELIIEPDAWFDCFPDQADPESCKNEIIQRVRESERGFAQARTSPVIGAKKIALQSIYKAYMSQRKGKKTFSKSIFIIATWRYNHWREAHHSSARKIFQQWRNGDSSAKLPPGTFWPGGHLASPCDVTIQSFYPDF